MKIVKAKRKNIRHSEMGGKWKTMTKSVKQTWRSPPSLIKKITKHFGEIMLDPCASFSPKHQFAVQNYFNTKVGVDGLKAPWRGFGLVYANPEYGRVIMQWIEKAAWEFKLCQDYNQKKYRDDELILLTPSRTDTVWFTFLREHATAMCFIKGRLKFDQVKDPAPFASLLAYFGPRPKHFKKVFSSDGWVVINR